MTQKVLISVVFPSVLAMSAMTLADIYQWEWVDRYDHSQGRQQSSTLCPDGAGQDAVPNVRLSNLDLTQAWLLDADLDSAWFSNSTLTDADLSHAVLTNARFWHAQLTDAGLNQANLTDASFWDATLAVADLSRANAANANFKSAALALTSQPPSPTCNLR